MLSAADAQVVERDPHIPGLATLLDASTFAETLSRAYPEAGVASVEPCYIRYKPGVSCLVGYSVMASAGCLDLYARAHNPGSGDKIEKAANRRSVVSPLGLGIVVLGDKAVVIYPFPNDHELPALQSLAEDAPRRQMFECLLPDHSHLWDGQPVTLRYKPERRYVARLSTESDRGAVLKFYTRRDYLAAARKIVRFADQPPLKIVRRLGKSKQYHAASLEWVEGPSLRDTLTQSDDAAESCRIAGAALARLHAQKPKRLPSTWTAERYADALVTAAAAVAHVLPARAESAHALARRIGEKLIEGRWRSRRAVHGDFAADQIVLCGPEAAFVDFDRAAYGDPRIDLGTFGARLSFDVISGRLPRDRADSAFAAVLEAYRNESKKDVTRNLDRFIAVGLLMCAVEPFRYRHPDWPDQIEAIIARAEELADGGPRPD